MRRLENVFESMSELSFQPDIGGALDLACDTLEAELPTAAVAAELYDIDADRIRIVAARGLEQELVRGTVLSRARCMAGYAAEGAIVVSGETGAADWLGTTEAGSTVLLCPILHEANLLGMIALAEPLCSDRFDAHDLELVAYVAAQLAEFIQSHRMRPSLHAPAPTTRGVRSV
jgi:GAF domain-containing protein